jgi:hypothetical protein
MKLSSALLLLLPLSVFSRLTTMKDSTATNKAALDLGNSNRHVYFEDSMEEHPEMRGLIDEINNDKDDLDDDSQMRLVLLAIIIITRSTTSRITTRSTTTNRITTRSTTTATTGDNMNK